MMDVELQGQRAVRIVVVAATEANGHSSPKYLLKMG